MNTPNKISLFRFLVAIIIVLIFVFPYHLFNIVIPKIAVNSVMISVDYIVVGILFIIGSVSDFLDGYLARKNDLVTTFGKFIDPIADKILVNTTVILLIGKGLLDPLFGVIFISRDIIVDTIRIIAIKENKVIAASKWGKLKTVSQMIAITLVIFHNLPFEIYGLRVTEVFLVIAAIASIYSGLDYYKDNKDIIYKEV